MTMFDRLKKLCEEQKISVVELEEKLDFGRNSLYGWKKKIPNGANLEKVADYFNVSVDYLLGRTDVKRNFYSIVSENNTDTDILTIQRAVNKMTPEERKKTIAILGTVFDGLFDSED
ncbi:hypothetical protein B1B04_13035 [Lysinibacillus sp. KCTC 33748]|uniref:helix-turn-helix domain-containing protein n=1 Tax=unclassified Lysinibacillus TaxID=2636778 RepID=UPI0009A8F0FB|nr:MULTISPECIES: helix-turn-helix transcriptional regulator [unclassified Lysinibacillus]OXS73206.1 hypothetical protein B1B04_13035 [Lysinibacillus sp. KCTC 33748]SKB82588.1 Helix-turn-helix [Lysinibacillus sp. AC-3]